MKWLSKAAPHDSTPEACAITISSATAAAMLRTWNGSTCQGLPHVLWASVFFANANLFLGGSVRSAPGVIPRVRFFRCQFPMDEVIPEAPRQQIVPSGKPKLGS